MWQIPEAQAPPRDGIRRSSEGFTLLELLVALSILSFIMASLYISLGSSATHAHRLRDRLEQQQAARLALQRIMADLEGAFIPPTGTNVLFEGIRGEGETGRSDRVEFVASHYVWEEPEKKVGDLALIAYSLALPPDGQGNRLVRHKKPLHGEAPREEDSSIVILDGVRELAFEYLDQQGGRSEVWPARDAGNKAALPAAVRVTLVLGPSEEEALRFSTLVAIPTGARMSAPPESAAGEGAQGGLRPPGSGEFGR